MRPIRYEGAIVQTGAEFEVKVAMAFPTEADARAVSAWLHETIKAKVEATGGRLAPIAPGLTGVARLITLQKAGLR